MNDYPPASEPDATGSHNYIHLKWSLDIYNQIHIFELVIDTV